MLRTSDAERAWTDVQRKGQRTQPILVHPDPFETPHGAEFWMEPPNTADLVEESGFKTLGIDILLSDPLPFLLMVASIGTVSGFIAFFLPVTDDFLPVDILFCWMTLVQDAARDVMHSIPLNKVFSWDLGFD
jgi:hypothetical protein